MIEIRLNFQHGSQGLSAGNRFVNEISGGIQAHLEDAPDSHLIVDNENRTSRCGALYARGERHPHQSGTTAPPTVL